MKFTSMKIFNSNEAIVLTLHSCNSKEVIDVLKSQAILTSNSNYVLINNYKDVVHGLVPQVKHYKQFFIATRRKAPLCKRQASKSHTINRLFRYEDVPVKRCRLWVEYS